MAIVNDTVYCDCCGTELMAKVVGDNLVIKDRRHGKTHMAIVPLKALLDKAGFTIYAGRESLKKAGEVL